MILYVESNFVLEIALGQEQGEPAEAILRAAEVGAVDLVVSLFALSEPFGTVTQRGRTHRHVSGQLNEQIRDLARSRLHRQEVALLEPIPQVLTGIAQREADSLTEVVGRLLNAGRGIGIDAINFVRARGYQARYSFTAQDAIIYAGVISDLTVQPSDEATCFISKNGKDFPAPALREKLVSFNCAFVDNVAEGLHLARSG